MVTFLQVTVGWKFSIFDVTCSARYNQRKCKGQNLAFSISAAHGSPTIGHGYSYRNPTENSTPSFPLAVPIRVKGSANEIIRNLAPSIGRTPKRQTLNAAV